LCFVAARCKHRTTPDAPSIGTVSPAPLAGLLTFRPLHAIFFKLLIPAIAGRFISGDEGHEARQRPGYQVTPKLSLSCPMRAGNKTDLAQKMSPLGVKQAAYGETRAANIKKSL
jgi:hypothetical protein